MIHKLLQKLIASEQFNATLENCDDTISSTVSYCHEKKVHRELHAHLIGKIHNFFFHPRTRSNKIFCLQLANNLVLSISLGPMFCRLGFFNPVLAYGEGRSTALAD